jgi:hypothetical protein
MVDNYDSPSREMKDKKLSKDLEVKRYKTPQRRSTFET